MANTRLKYNQLKETPGKRACKVATTANISNLLSGAPDTVDGVSLSVKDRVLVKDQSTGSQNGIYEVVTVGTGADGVWQRSSDLSTSDDTYEGIDLYVTSGNTNADTIWHLTTPDPITIGTTSLTFSQFQSGASAGIYGGSGTVPASTVATTTDNISFVGPAVEASGGVNIGTTSNAARLHVLDTSAQFRLSYDGSHYTDINHNNTDLLYFKGIVTTEDSEARFLSNASSSYKIRFGYGNNLANSWNASSINIGGKASFRLTYGSENPVTNPFIDIQTNGVTKLGMNNVNGGDVGIGISASQTPAARLDVWDSATDGGSRVIRTRNGNDAEIMRLDANGSFRLLNYVFPLSDGLNGQALVTNGSGVLSFGTVSGGGGGGVTGSGTTNYVPKWTGVDTLSSTSLIYTTDTGVGFGTTSTNEILDIDGNAKITGQIYVDIPTTLTPTGNSQTIDWNNGNIQIVDFESAPSGVTFSFSNPKTGGTYTIKIIQGANSTSVNWPGTMKWEGGTSLTPTTTNNAVDLVTMVYDGTDYLASYGTNFA